METEPVLHEKTFRYQKCGVKFFIESNTPSETSVCNRNIYVGSRTCEVEN